jgi:hypothetical protein
MRFSPTGRNTPRTFPATSQLVVHATSQTSPSLYESIWQVTENPTLQEVRNHISEMTFYTLHGLGFGWNRPAMRGYRYDEATAQSEDRRGGF